MKTNFLNRNFGIELEIGNEKSQSHIENIVKSNSFIEVKTTNKWAQSINNNFWHIKYDSSCGVKGKPIDHGWEIASFKAFGVFNLIHICDIAKELHNNDCRVNENCGLHIHADVSDFSPYEMGSLLNRWLKIEKYLLNTVPMNRRNNIHCKPLFNKLCIKNVKQSNPENTWKLLKPTTFKVHNNNQKRFTLNLINYAKFIKFNKKGSRATIELRLPEGTLEWENIYNWTYFYLNFINFSLKNPCLSNSTFVNNIDSFFKTSGINNSKNLDIKCWFEKRIKDFKY